MAKSTTHVSGIIAVALVFTFSGASQAEQTAEQRWACTHDAFQFCSSEIPDVERITVCMIKNVKKLSPLCRSQFK